VDASSCHHGLRLVGRILAHRCHTEGHKDQHEHTSHNVSKFHNALLKEDAANVILECSAKKNDARRNTAAQATSDSLPDVLPYRQDEVGRQRLKAVPLQAQRRYGAQVQNDLGDSASSVHHSLRGQLRKLGDILGLDHHRQNNPWDDAEDHKSELPRG